MGLDVSHDCWTGGYGAFQRWRTEIAKAADIPLALMDGFFEYPEFALERLGPKTNDHGGVWRWSVDKLLDCAPISWDTLKPSPLHALLNHSDCDGDIEWEHCGGIADELEKLLPLLPEGGSGGHIGDWREKTQYFIDGLRLAYSRKENVEFH